MLTAVGATRINALTVHPVSHFGVSMIDLIYVGVTVVFFVLMLLYVRACERLGRDTTDSTERTP
jgi:uncharacterized membrane protein